MYRILVTGGSGFLGTNLIERLKDSELYEICNVDLVAPKIQSHRQFWTQIDIRDLEGLEQTVRDFGPSHVVHFAARTDLRGETMEDYDSNTVGVGNLVRVLAKCSTVTRVIFTSSMYVCRPGYVPKDFQDYDPHTAYGESKVRTEEIVKSANPSSYCWCITRPTSIWGPWFGEPYDQFFKIVLSRRYFHFSERACTKTFGYVDNTMNQMAALLEAGADRIQGKTFYLGDSPAYDISEWADEIARACGYGIRTLPFIAFQLAAKLGDALAVLGVSFPMTSFRLKNMLTNNVHNLEPIEQIAGAPKVTRREGISCTLTWLKESDQP